MNIPTSAKVADSKGSYVEIFDDGVAMVGKDATMLFAAQTLLTAMKLYLKTGMVMTRGLTGPRMLKLATMYTKNEYKGNGKYDRALVDLNNWVATMKCAMPVVDSKR